MMQQNVKYGSLPSKAYDALFKDLQRRIAKRDKIKMIELEDLQQQVTKHNQVVAENTDLPNLGLQTWSSRSRVKIWPAICETVAVTFADIASQICGKLLQSYPFSRANFS